MPLVRLVAHYSACEICRHIRDQPVSVAVYGAAPVAAASKFPYLFLAHTGFTEGPVRHSFLSVHGDSALAHAAPCP